MYTDRAHRYMQAMEAQYGPDYLHERYAIDPAVDPTDYDPDTGGSGAKLPFSYWVEGEADQWEAARRQHDAARRTQAQREWLAQVALEIERDIITIQSRIAAFGDVGGRGRRRLARLREDLARIDALLRREEIA